MKSFKNIIALFIALVLIAPTYTAAAKAVDSMGVSSPWVLTDDGTNAGNKASKYEIDGSTRATLQDQTTPVIIVPFNFVDETSTLAAPAAYNDTSVTVTDDAGMADGDHFVIYGETNTNYYIGQVVGTPVANVVQLDTPIDSAFPAGELVSGGNTNMAVDGSSTPVTYTLRGADPGIDITIDITRILFQCQTLTAVDLSTFGDIAGGLTKGLVLRRVDGTTQNIFNIKTNGDLAGIAYDFTVAQATNPQQGVDGFNSRLTFAGQSKIGVALRIGPGDSLEFIIQDDLSTISLLKVIAEGHVVQ